jgi:hypothetical protein
MFKFDTCCFFFAALIAKGSFEPKRVATQSIGRSGVRSANVMESESRTFACFDYSMSASASVSATVAPQSIQG